MRLRLLFLLCLLLPPLACAQWLQGYAARVTVELDDATAGVAGAHFYAGGLCRKDGSDIRVVAGSVPAKFMVVSCDPDGRTHVAFAPVPGQRRVYIYFGNPNPQGKVEPFDPLAGLLMVTYPNGVANNVEAARTLAANATRAYGSDFVGQVFFGHHPFGGPENFTSYFRGAIMIPMAGEWTIATNSNGFSQVLIDGKSVVIKQGGGPTGDARFTGKVTLEKGIHRFEYLNTMQGDRPAMVAAWKAPGKPNFEAIPASAFPSAARGKIVAYEKLGKNGAPFPAAFFEATLKGDVVRGALPDTLQATIVELSSKSLTGTPPTLFEWEFGDGIKVKGKEGTVTHVYFALDEPMVSLSVFDGAGRLVDTIRRKIKILPAMGEEPQDEPAKIARIAEIAQSYTPAIMSAGAADKMLKFLDATGQRAAFVKLIESAIASGAKVDVFRAQLADAYFASGQFAKALEQYQKATQTETHVKLRVLESLIRVRKYDEALASAKKYHESGIKTKARPLERGALLNQMTANVKIDRQDEAFRILEEFCMKNSSAVMEAQTYLLRAQALQTLRQFDAALTDLEFAEKIEPKSNFIPEILFEQAVCLNVLGKVNEAGKKIAELKKVYPNSPFASRSLTASPQRK